MEYSKDDWKIEGERIIVGKDRELINGLTVGGEIIATVNDKANAHLIASAPALYEALKALLFQFAVAVEHPYSKDKEVYDQAGQALAKAEGG